MYYINFYFKELTTEGEFASGIFECPDLDVFCRFYYNMKNKEYKIWDNNIALEELLPIPFYWLDKKMDERGFLNKTEAKISF